MSEGYKLGNFSLLVARRVLVEGEVAVLIGGRAFDILLKLVRSAGNVVETEELIRSVWNGQVVETANVAVHIAAIRKALGLQGKTDIVTVSRRGYCYAGSVERLTGRTAGEVATETGPDQVKAIENRKTPQGNLPGAFTSFVGRGPELRALGVAIETNSLVTIVGAGGIGKTRMALELAKTLVSTAQDGVWLLELAELSTLEMICEAFARVFGLSLPPKGDPISYLANFLREKACLIVLDNCEHVISATKVLIEELRKQCSAIKFLATSREALALDGEVAFRLSGLNTPEPNLSITAEQALQFDAVRLFEKRASERIGFVLDDETAVSVAEICWRLDGGALAIELAAARMTVLSPAELCRRLVDQFVALRHDNRTNNPRHGSLKAAIDWSFSLLPPEERRALCALSVFGGKFTVAATADLLGLDHTEAIDLLSLLVDKSLVSKAPSSNDSSRFVLLQTTRSYAASRLAEFGPHDYPRRAAEYLVRWFLNARTSWQTTGTATWLARHVDEIGNLRSALAWAFAPDGDVILGQTLLCYSSRLWIETGQVQERNTWRDLALDRVDALTPPAIVAQLLVIAVTYDSLMSPARHEPIARAVALARALDDPFLLAEALIYLGLTVATPTDTSPGEPYLQEAIALLQPLGVTKDLIQALDALAWMRINARNLDDAKTLIDQAIALGGSLDSPATQMNMLVKRAEIAFIEQDVDLAVRLSADAIEACRKTRYEGQLMIMLGNRVGYLVAARDPSAAWDAARQSLELARRLVSRTVMAGVVERLALGLALSDDLENAARLAGFGDAFYRSVQIGRELLRTGTGIRSRAASTCSNLRREIDCWPRAPDGAAIRRY